MKREPITQATLATLAATLPDGDARERVTLAAEIWTEAGNLLEDRELVAKTRELADQSAKYDWQPLDVFLREALETSKLSKPKQREKYCTFLANKATQATGCTWTFDGKTVSACDLTPAQARKVAEIWLAEHAESGIVNPAMQRAEFVEWLESEKKRTKSETTSLGGIARAKKAEAKRKREQAEARKRARELKKSEKGD